MDFALGMLVVVAALAGGQEPRDGGHVRTVEARVRAEINEGTARSSVFRDLVARLDASDVIVYIETECPMQARLFGRLTFMAAGGGRRYVSVRIACMLNDAERIAALAHELRHAVEIADDPSVVSVASLGALYRRIGFASHGVAGGAGFESGAAIQSAHRVWAELGRSGE